MTQLPLPKPGILDIAPYVAGKSAAKPGARVIKLSSNESPLGASPKAVEAYRAEAVKLHRYPDSSHAKLREAIAEIYGLNADQIVCGAGSDELIGLLVHAYAGAGDEILMCRHGFLMYRIYAQGAGAGVRMAPEQNLTADVDALLAAVTPATKIVFVANPNNPTGSYISAAELARLRHGLPPHVLLVIDGAYSEYVQHTDYSDGTALAATTQNTVALRTFSKIYGLPALRVGWGYFPPHVAEVLNRLRGPFNVSAPALAAAAAAVRDTAHVQRSVEHNTRQLAWLAGEITALGLAVAPSVANFLLIRFESAEKASAVNRQLLDAGIIIREVSAYGLPEYLRATVGLEDENRALLSALKAAL